ncbi:MAG: hypothetical protein ACRD45_07915 [Bryobacteraceae bacterium]
MASRLVNVRLDEERLRKTRMLREQGLALSDVVREAIDERFERAVRSRKVSDTEQIVRRIFEQYPDPAGLPSRGYDVQDRKAARAVIVAKLRHRSG